MTICQKPWELLKIGIRELVVEKLSFFGSDSLIFLLHTYSNHLNYEIPRMGRNFDDYLDFQQKAMGI